ncbi:bile acid:sodium symporter family protein [Halieaceae bacterium IMCC14734]|uniref:Bile acid:sodium symporter family protein n=1 Tax=Candidatus Litorirhabdus singularis TaxID=2518993 RepID=A0ABT3TDQ8_9GAMM|nr:bile acid:sodium symporter [Candidatus Litorirhabdus singularis]MCX2980443.1 bile acid:sodium symporter family protein [Candidatus Litorirhabdus singularis]
MFDFYIRHEYWFAAVQLSLAMLGMGATLRIRDFAAVFLKPRPLLVGLLVQMILVPLSIWALISWAVPEPGLAIGLALCAAIPGGTMSNVFTFLARGHVPLSIAMTAVTTLACLVTTPIVLGLLIAQHMPADFDMPAAQMALEIALILLLPLLLGMLVLHFVAEIAPRFSRYCIRGSIFCIALIIIGATGADRIDMVAFGTDNLQLVFVMLVILIVISWLVPLFLKLKSEECTAINIEVTVRNGNLGLLIKASLFPAVVGMADPVGDMVLTTVLAYGGMAIMAGLGQIFLHGLINKRRAAA